MIIMMLGMIMVMHTAGEPSMEWTREMMAAYYYWATGRDFNRKLRSLPKDTLLSSIISLRESSSYEEVEAKLNEMEAEISRVHTLSLSLSLSLYIYIYIYMYIYIKP